MARGGRLASHDSDFKLGFAAVYGLTFLEVMTLMAKSLPTSHGLVDLRVCDGPGDHRLTCLFLFD